MPGYGSPNRNDILSCSFSKPLASSQNIKTMVKKNDVIAIIIVLFITLLILGSIYFCLFCYRVPCSISDTERSSTTKSEQLPPPPLSPQESGIRILRDAGGNDQIRVPRDSGIRVPRQTQAA